MVGPELSILDQLFLMNLIFVWFWESAQSVELHLLLLNLMFLKHLIHLVEPLGFPL